MRTLVLLALLLASCSSWGTSYVEPEREIVYSSNRKFQLVIDPRSDSLIVRSSAWPHRGLWRCKVSIWHHNYYVSDTGDRAVVVLWPFCMVDELDSPAILVFCRGTLERAYSYRTVSSPRKYNPDEVGPIGEHHRIWQEGVDQKGNRIFIHTVGRRLATIDLKDGRLRRGNAAQDPGSDSATGSP